MRLCLVCSLGLLSTACGLSMNPDLPSTEEENSPPFGGETDPVEHGVPDAIVDEGGGELPPHFGAPPGSGGSGSAGPGAGCIGPGGAGGAENCGPVP